VCTAHLNTRTTIEIAGNDAQCAELAALLARRASARTVTFGGDVNRQRSCAPDGLWTRTDGSAGQAPGLQHVYGSGALRSPSAEVVPATHSDHDVLLVSAHVAAPE
jgi:endonuclease/exonuclease/phosphatase (EEP) superfamily protein YafD